MFTSNPITVAQSRVQDKTKSVIRPKNIRHEFQLYDASNTYEEEDFAYTARSVAWELIPFSALSRRGLNPIALAYSSSPPDNGLGQYVSSPGNRAYCYAELALLPWRWPKSSPVFILPTRGGMARLSWPTLYYYVHKTVVTSTIRARTSSQFSCLFERACA